jgi:NAD(P)-dependent dehydrogenase (short-subunit alcohol dehydrogenase family)
MTRPADGFPSVDSAAPSGPVDARLAVVVGASGGIGAALVERLARDGRFDRVLALSRTPVDPVHPGVVPGILDLADEAGIRAGADRARSLGVTRLVIVATGALHGEGLDPEKHWGALDAQALARAFAVNAIGPAIVAKHFLPLLPRQGRSVFAALSARVGSIEDNRLGGWYGYRASKAALNMLLKTLAIELARRAPEAVCVGLHPGTVETRLSRPFLDGRGARRPFTPAQAAENLLAVLDRASQADSGCVLGWDGSRIPA